MLNEIQDVDGECIEPEKTIAIEATIDTVM